MIGVQDIIDPGEDDQKPLWATCGPGVYRDHARQRQQQLDIKDEHMIDPGQLQSLFYVIAAANWDKTKAELDNTALCTLAMLGLREVKDAIERPIAHIDNGGVAAFRRAQERLNTVLDEVARRKELVEESMARRSRGLGAPAEDIPANDIGADEDEDGD